MTRTRRQFCLVVALCVAPPLAKAHAVPQLTHEEMEQRLQRLANALESKIANTAGDALSPPERVFRCVWELEAEVNNGGFTQYFFNSSGRHAPDAPAALRAIGAAATAVLVDAALELMGRGVSWGDDVRRQAAVERLEHGAGARLEALDAKFYACPDDLTVKLHAYVAKHRLELAANS